MAAQFSYFHQTIKSIRRSAVPSTLISAVFLVVSILPDLFLYSWSSNFHSYHHVVSVRSYGSNLTLPSWQSLHSRYALADGMQNIIWISFLDDYINYKCVKPVSHQLHIIIGSLLLQVSLSAAVGLTTQKGFLPTEERIRYTRCS